MENKTETALVQLVETSGLEKTKSEFILEKFKEYFKIASDWENKAKTLIVDNESQITEMKMAREGRLFLKKKRVEIENTRKELKEQSIREGKAIEGIANILKGLIEPIEDYLFKQENFIEIKEENRKNELQSERIKILSKYNTDISVYDLKNMSEEAFVAIINGFEQKIEEEKKAEAEKERIRKENEAEQERIRLENEKLKKEAIEKEKLAEIERKKQADLLAKEKAKAEAEKKVSEAKLHAEKEAREKAEKELKAKAEAEKKVSEAKLHAEKEAREKAEKELKAKAEAEKKVRLEAENKLKEQQKAPDKNKLLALADKIDNTELPIVSGIEAKNAIKETKELLLKVGIYLRKKASQL